MATADRILQLKLIADVKQPTTALKGLSGRLKSSGKALASWGKALTGALVIGGIEKVIDSLGDAEAAFVADQDAAARLSQTWKNLGRDTGQLAGVLQNLGDKANNLGFDDAETITAFNTFLSKTGSVRKSTMAVQAAWDLARAKGIPFATAVKKIGARLDDLKAALRENRGQSARWARNHPIAVAINKISDAWGTFIGSLKRGKVDAALRALSDIASQIGTVLFGGEVAPGIQTEGIIASFTGVGGKIVDKILEGLVDLGGRIQTAWDTQIATVDWSKAIPDALGTFWTETLQPFLAGLAEKGPVATAAVVGLSVAFAALGIALLPISVPMLAIGLAIAGITAALLVLAPHLQNLQTFLQGIQQQIQNFVQPALEGLGGAFDLFGDTVQNVLNTISPVFDTVLGHIANAAGLVANVIQNLVNAWNTLQSLIGGSNDLDPVERALERARRKFPGIGGGGRSGGKFAAGGIVTRPTIGLIGEAGPEAVIPLKRAGGFGGITVNVTAGIGDPVAIGREVDRVLRAYRGRVGAW